MSGPRRGGGRRGGARRGGAHRGGARSGDVEEVVIDSSAGNDASASEGCRPCKLSVDVFRDNSLSEGGKMKELGKVIERCSMELKKPENVNCRVESFGATISKFDEDKRKLVKEMGFAGLYALVDRQLLLGFGESESPRKQTPTQGTTRNN